MLRGMVAGHKKPDQTEVLYSGSIYGEYPLTITHSLTRQCIMVDCDYYEIGHYIISDRNLGATAYMGETGKTTSDWYGKYYQWGNNFGFTPPVSNKTNTKVDPTGYGPGNYFSSSTLITDDYYGNNIFTTPASINDLWGITTNTNEARRGPCDAGFHVPTYDELETLLETVEQIGYDIGGDAALAVLRIPKAGKLETWGGYERGSYAYLWGADRNDGGYGYDVEPGRYNYYYYSYGGSIYTEYSVYGLPIRAFKNSAVEPEGAGWVLVAEYEDYNITRVRENTTLGLITIKTNYFRYRDEPIERRTITIQNKNVGATQVYNSGDTLSDANCGKYFQRGNNYGFSYSGNNTSYDKVDVSGYSWQNPYSRNVFVTNSDGYIWWTIPDGNVRGGATQGDIAKQGPCPSGWHIPTADELEKIRGVLYFLGDAGLTYDEACAKLLIPKSGYIASDWRDGGTLQQAGERFALWGCDLDSDNEPTFYDSYDGYIESYRICNAYSIRPFRNT